MSHKDVYKCVSAIVPCTHLAYPTGKAPALPWAVFELDTSDGMYADNKKYATVNKWTLELLENARDEALERKIEDALTETFSPCEVEEAWLESEQCVQVRFNFTEIEKLTDKEA